MMGKCEMKGCHYPENYLTWLRLYIDRHKTDKADKVDRKPFLPLKSPEEESLLSQKLAVELFGTSPQKRLAAQKEIGQIGPMALGDLIPLLNHRDWWRRRGSMLALGDMTSRTPAALSFLIRSLEDPQPEVRFAVARALGKMGPKAYYCLPHLKRSLLFEDHRVAKLWMIFALSGITGQKAWALQQFRQILKDPEKKLRWQMVALLEEMGEEAFPLLCETLRDADEKVRIRAAAAVSEIYPKEPMTSSEIRALRQALKDPSEEVRRALVQSLVKMGNRVEPLLPYLVESLGDSHREVRENLKGMFLALGKDSLPRWISYLGKSSPSVHLGLVELLGEMAPSNREALSTLKAMMAEAPEDLQLWLQWAIRLQGEESPLEDSLKKALSSSKREVRLAGAQIFAKFKTLSTKRMLLPMVLVQLKDPEEDEEIKERLLEGIGAMVPQCQEGLRILLQFLQASDGKVARKALSLFKGENFADHEILRSLIGLLSSPESALSSREIIQTVSSFGERVLPFLEPLENSLDEKTQIWVQWAICHIKVDPAMALTRLGRFLYNENWPIRREVVVALGEVGPPVIPTLLQALKDDQEEVRREALRVIGNLAPESSSAVPYLIGAIHDPEISVREEANRALGKMGAFAASAVSDLSQALYDEEAKVRKSAVMALGKIGSEAASVAPSISQALYDEDGDTRKFAALTLGKLGYLARGVVSVLIRTLKDPLRQVRAAAARAIGEIKPSDESAVEPLLELLEDSQEEVKTEAISALGKLGKAAAGAAPRLLQMMEECPVHLMTPIRTSLDQIRRG